jgi:hypothetical protein
MNELKVLTQPPLYDVIITSDSFCHVRGLLFLSEIFSRQNPPPLPNVVAVYFVNFSPGE